MIRNLVVFLFVSSLHIRTGMAQDQTITGDAFALTETDLKLKARIEQIFYNPSSELVFVLDSSGSVGLENYKRSRDFIHETSKIISVSPSSTHVSVVSYSDCHNIYVYIDYITTPGGKNKCTFLNAT